MTRARYPGAQPFTDDPLSRAVFFGREPESRALSDLILANRLVVVYAKSGVGKTSLLQAGVAELLRSEGHLPLFVRVNDPKQHPVRAVFEGVADAARRQGVEYEPGDQSSLWHFFKTAECWRADQLLTPVLVLDQFEELFTLHDPGVRAQFLLELGHLVRGVRPVLPEPAPDGANAVVSDSAPAIRIVVSLREDYLGSLEEGADRIPKILDHRFRLSALTLEAAAVALQGPAQVEHDQLQTRPFRFKPGTVDAILSYLSRRTRSSTSAAARGVEPFQLQLICQRVEAVAADRQAKQGSDVEVGLDDLGGHRGLDATLRDFVKNVLAGVEPRSMRRRVRRLCQNYLISPEGRRLSLERGEIRRILKIRPDTLASLVDCRLLRADQRAESWYFELSHDSLISPILAGRRPLALMLGGLGLLGSTLLALGSLGGVLAAALFAWLPFAGLPDQPPGFGAMAIVAVIFALAVAVGVAWMGIAGVRRSVETLNRFASSAK